MREILDLKRFFVVCAVAVCASMVARGALAADASCGVNLFNPMILTEADFRAGNDNSYSGQWNKNLLNAYLSTSDFGFDATKKYSLRYKMKCDGDNGKFFFVLKNSDGQVFGPGNGTSLDEINVCATNPGTVVEIKIDNVEKVVAVEAYGDGTGLVQISEIMLGLSTKIDGATNFIAYSPCIKLATTKMNETRMSAIENRLDGVRTTINNLITQMQTNSGNIGGLQVDKQTRPNSSCPADKKCLLVKDMQNNDNWYEIVDCNENAVLSNLNYDWGLVRFGPGEPWGWQISSGNQDLMCSASEIGCQDGEWVTSYDRVVPGDNHPYGLEIVFGVMRRVAIVNDTRGTIVRLPGGVQSGNVCVCRATRYRVWDNATSAYGASQSINTDKWFVAGTAYDDENCFDMCGDERRGVTKLAYYRDISTSCSPNASEASMCYYHTFFATAADSQTDPTNGLGFTVGDSNGTGMCATGGAFANSSHCATAGSWIVQYKNSDSNTTVGYVYGMARAVTVPDGTAQYSIVDVNMSDLSLTRTGHNAVVCVVQGYKAQSDASETDVNLNKAFVVSVGEIGDGDVTGYSRYCADAVVYTNHQEYTPAMNWYRQLANMCVTD